MQQELMPNLFRVEVPLPDNPLKATNSYIIKGGDRNLVVDTGMNRPECERALRSGLAELGVELPDTDFFITHFHADHVGLVTSLSGEGATIYFNEPETKFVTSVQKSGGFWKHMLEVAREGGFPEEEIHQSLSRHPGFRYTPPKYPEFAIVRQGDVLTAGEYRFECVETPGHTMGHMCLYEPEKKLLISGDHILGDITPNITAWSDELDPLGEYLASLNKISAYDVDLVLPGHRSIVKDCRARIEELRQHHKVRLDEVLAILDEGSQAAYQVASRMTWDLEAESWSQFPVMQKWFATGEAIAHLQYLERRGLVQREVYDGKTVFSVN